MTAQAPRAIAANNFLTETHWRHLRELQERRQRHYLGDDWRESSDIVSGLKDGPQDASHSNPPNRRLIEAIESLSDGLKRLVYRSLYAPQSSRVSATFHAGEVVFWLAGSEVARRRIEPLEQWQAARAAMNPTGSLADAPPGVPRILCLCTIGMGTGVLIRWRAELILQAAGVDAYLEVTDRHDAKAAAVHADIILATEDEASVLEGRDLDNWGAPLPGIHVVIDGRKFTPPDLHDDAIRSGLLDAIAQVTGMAARRTA